MQGMLLLMLCLITLFALLFTPWLTRLFAPGFIQDPARFELATHMLRITFPYLLLISMTAFYASILNAHGNFAAASFTPVMLNLIMILAALFLASHFAQPVVALAWGVLIAGITQFLFLMPFLKRKNLLLLPRLFWQDEGVRKVGKLLIPALFGVSVAQISLLVDTLFASFLPIGSITWLYYSDRLIYFPLGIFGVALATVILPHLSRQHTRRSLPEFSASLDWALRCVLVIAIPSAIGLYMLAVPLFSTLFQYGKFQPHDAEMAALSLRAYAFGLPAFMLVKVLASGFYAQQNIKTPVRIAVVALAVNMVLNVALIWHLKHAGLALATALASTVNAALLCGYLISKGMYQVQKGWMLYGLQLSVAGAAICGFIAFISPASVVWLHGSGSQRVLHLLGLLLGSVVIYFVCLRGMGLRLRDFREKRSSQ
jgi:putative peptidoglycan lipid II flippase